MHRFRHLMVALGRGGADPGLIRYAAAVARLGTAEEVRFVHVLPSGPAEAGGPPNAEVVAGLQEAVRRDFAGVPETARVRCEAHPGPLLDRLLALAAEQEEDLLLVGHRREHPGRRALARRLAMKAPCSVWMVPDGSAPRLTRLLVPVDFSEYSADALQVAAAMARACGHEELLALHVYFNEATVTYEGYDAVLRGREEEAFRRFVAPLDTHGVKVTPLFEEGAQVGHVINRVAERRGADLVVLPTRGRSRSASILLGSVAEEVLIETRLPLLVVKHYGARMGVLQALLDRDFRRKRGPRFD